MQLREFPNSSLGGIRFLKFFYACCLDNLNEYLPISKFVGQSDSEHSISPLEGHWADLVLSSQGVEVEEVMPHPPGLVLLQAVDHQAVSSEVGDVCEGVVTCISVHNLELLETHLGSKSRACVICVGFF